MQQPCTNLTNNVDNHFDIIEPNKKHQTLNHARVNNKHFYTTCQSLIQDIISCAGYSLTRISTETDIPLITLRRLRTGYTKEPRLAAFHRIFSLYCKVCLCKNLI